MLGGESHGQWGKQTFLLQLVREKKEKQEGKRQMREIYLLQRQRVYVLFSCHCLKLAAFLMNPKMDMLSKHIHVSCIMTHTGHAL